MRETARILGKLLADGEMSISDTELITDFHKPEVRADLDVWGDELGFKLIEIAGRIYLVPNIDSDLLAVSIRDVRESESRNDRMIDAFLQCYIIMTVLWMFYGGKNNNPKRTNFLQVNDIVATLDERFINALSVGATVELEVDFEINFQQIATHWNAMQVDDPDNPNRRKTKKAVILSACRFLEKEKLLLLLDENRDVRATSRLDDLMIGHYLDIRRIEEIHELFDMMEGLHDAEDK